MARVFIGTSGFSYPHWADGVFYPPGLSPQDWFAYYVDRFDTVELNVSFYRLPKKATFAKWRQIAGPNFIFAVKGNRFITHIKKLKNCQEAIERFFSALAGLKPEDQGRERKTQVGQEVVLWQLPPGFKADPVCLESFLALLPQDWRHAFEFREESWLKEAIYKRLERKRMAVVFQDNPTWPISERVTADFVYLRFHGRTSLYSSSYPEEELERWAQKTWDWLKKKLDVYLYFNNDALGYAVENAQKLQGLIAGRKG